MAKQAGQKKKISSLSVYFLMTILFSAIGVAIIVKAANIAFVEGKFWRALGEQHKGKDDVEFAKRGNIYSCKGELMATNVPCYRVFIDYKAGKFDKALLEEYKVTLAHALSKKFGDKSPEAYIDSINKGYKSGSRHKMLVHKDVTYIEYQEIRRMPFLNQHPNICGIHVEKKAQRLYPYGSLAYRTIGKLHADYSLGGENGLERQYDSLLRGKDGLKSEQRIRNKRPDIIKVAPIDGKSLVTTIDVVIQDITEKALVDKLKEVNAESGTAVVMDVKTGEIKAIANMGKNTWGGYDEKRSNYAVTDQSEPGSTFKIASMIVALEAGVEPGDSVDVGNGVYYYGRAERNITDHNAHRGGYGKITAEKAIWYSSNIGVAKLVLEKFEDKPELFVQQLKKMGIDKPLDLEIPEAGRAWIKDPSDKKNWWGGSLPWMSFGYETRIPPIYTLTYFNAIANDGKMVKPYFTKKIMDGDRVIQTFGTQVINPSICSKSTLKKIQKMMVEVVDSGTGRPVKSNIMSIAGKTGTVVLSRGTQGYGEGGARSHQVSFCGYFPADNPKYTCIVVVRRPQVSDPSGGAISGGVFKNIAERIYATTVLMGVDDLPIDSALRKAPLVKSGSRKEVDYLLNELNVDYSRADRSVEWIRAVNDSAGITMKPVEIVENLVPSVIGMGAKDAVYLLEKSGMRVSLSGSGRVASQSIQPGAKVQKNGFISIQLK